LSLDPLAHQYPSSSGYSPFGNSPTIIIDPDGERLIVVGSKMEKRKLMRQLRTLTNDKIIFNMSGEVLIKSHKIKNPNRNLEYGTNLLADIINDADVGTLMSLDEFKRQNSDNPIVQSSAFAGNGTADESLMSDNIFNGKGANATTFIDFDDNGILVKNADGTTGRTINIGMGHELIHMKNILTGTVAGESSTRYNDPDFGGTIDIEEFKVRIQENVLRDEQGVKKRAVPTVDNSDLEMPEFKENKDGK